jgi:antitoxin component YwqK of YwqJK toxin-antitoxin module
MKKLFLILICLPIIGFSQHRVSIEDLTDSNGKMNTDGKEVPSNGPSVIGVKYLGDLFTGIAYVETDNNQLVSEFNYKNGYLHGFKIWYESGKLRLDGQCIDIEMNEWNLKSWYENGNQHRNSHNLLVIKGNKFEKGSGTHFGTEWYENGQIKEEVIFEDGVVIKIACWDLNGDSIDCSQEEYDLEGESEAADDYSEDESAYVTESNVDEGFEMFKKHEKLSNLLFLIICLSLF